ncbi:GxxExxY protein [Altererythrobacter lauratis]
MRYKGVVVDNAFRIDILVEQKLVIELKSIERLAPVHGKQVLTYLRLMDLPLGLLMNFGQATCKDGLKRVANDYWGRIA